MEWIWLVIVPAAVLFYFLGTLGQSQSRGVNRQTERDMERQQMRVDRRGS